MHVRESRAPLRRRAAGVAAGAMLVALAGVTVPSVSASPRQAAQANPDDVSRSSNVKQVANVPKRSPLSDSFNSDIAFWNDYAFQGNYDGFTIWDISRPRSPQIVSQVLCPGGQGDVSVTDDGSLLFMSVDYARSDDTCTSEAASTGDATAWEGMRIFDISDLRNPDYAGAVRTDCGSHTHTLVPDTAGEAAYLYVSSYGPSERYPNCQPPHDNISIIEVPLDDPGTASVVATPTLFPDGGNAGTSGCHDITAYPDRNIAAGACMGDGILMDISDRTDPQVIDRVQDDNFAFYHSATFSNHGTKLVFTDELGGGGAPTCNAQVGPTRGADAIFDIAGAGDSRALQFRSYYKIPRYQSDTENCVAHNGSLIPVEGRDMMVQAWYQGGVSIFDFTNSSEPREVGYWDRGALDDDTLVLGGSWSAYYYNGFVYSSDIQQGLDVLDVRGLRSAKRVSFDVLNAQTQYRYDEGRPLSLPRASAKSERATRRNASPAPVILPGAPGTESRAVSAKQARSLAPAARSQRVQQANDADRMFVEMMIPHHFQATEMSRLAQKRSDNPRLRALAQRIRVEQGVEIAGLRGWQGRNGLPVSDARQAYRDMLDDGHMIEQMGMATRQEMTQLWRARGAQFDALFLDLMIPHHKGAVRMAEDVGVDGTDTFVRQLSADMIAAQSRQIYALEQMKGD